VSDIFGPVQPQTGLFLAAHEAPNLIALNVRNGQANDLRFKEPLARFASGNHRRDDRVAPDLENPFQGSNGIAFEQEP
jgi:hypothetical protein